MSSLERITAYDIKVLYLTLHNLSNRFEFLSTATVVILKLRILHVKEVISRSIESIRSIYYSYRL